MEKIYYAPIDDDEEIESVLRVEKSARVSEYLFLIGRHAFTRMEILLIGTIFLLYSFTLVLTTLGLMGTFRINVPSGTSAIHTSKSSL